MRRKTGLLNSLTSSPWPAAVPVAQLVLLGLLSCAVGAHGGTSLRERLLPEGAYLPFFPKREPIGKVPLEGLRKPTRVPSFWLDTQPVTNQEYLRFVAKNPEWRRSKVGGAFADDSYLKHWSGDLKLHSRLDRDRPVTNVSWFGATAYCRSKGKELPTNDQWEYAAEDAGKKPEEIKEKILAWYAIPNEKKLAKAGAGPPNSYGIRDLHGLIWEWTQDFNSDMTGSELRSDGTRDDSLFCGAGSLNAMNAADYAKFMRYSFRGSLRGDYTTANLGFRCAREEKK